MKSPPPNVTVIMRCKNSDWVIHQALAGLFSQSFRDFELLVVDSGSTDRTLDIVRRYPCRLIEIEAGDYYPGAVLNRAIGQARGDIIVFQNSDAVPLSSDALQALVSALDAPDVEAAFGRQIPRPEADTWVCRDYAAAFPTEGTPPGWMVYSLPFAAMRRSAWEANRFYTDAWGSEDTEWGCRAVRRGSRPRYVPAATVMHSHNYSLRQLYGRRFIEGEADAFIHGDTAMFAAVARRTLASAVRDLAACIRHRDWRAIFVIPVRRLVYHWAYLKGRRLGEHRIRSKDPDASRGQRTVLERYQA